MSSDSVFVSIRIGAYTRTHHPRQSHMAYPRRRTTHPPRSRRPKVDGGKTDESRRLEWHFAPREKRRGERPPVARSRPGTTGRVCYLHRTRTSYDWREQIVRARRRKEGERAQCAAGSGSAAGQRKWMWCVRAGPISDQFCDASSPPHGVRMSNPGGVPRDRKIYARGAIIYSLRRSGMQPL